MSEMHVFQRYIFILVLLNIYNVTTVDEIFEMLFDSHRLLIHMMKTTKELEINPNPMSIAALRDLQVMHSTSQ